MGASPIVAHVYRDMLAHFGEPDSSRVFDDPPPPMDSGWPERIDVFGWNPTADLDMYSFCTIGMSSKSQEGTRVRTELHFSVRGSRAAEPGLKRIPGFLANLALYPFIHATRLDFLHSCRNPGDIPCFDQCVGLVFLPAFVKNGWDRTTFQGEEIHYLNVVPISEEEYRHRDSKGVDSLYEYWEENGIDIFSDRKARD